jgi:hypothetical protein
VATTPRGTSNCSPGRFAGLESSENLNLSAVEQALVSQSGGKARAPDFNKALERKTFGEFVDDLPDCRKLKIINWACWERAS